MHNASDDRRLPIFQLNSEQFYLLYALRTSDAIPKKMQKSPRPMINVLTRDLFFVCVFPLNNNTSLSLLLYILFKFMLQHFFSRLTLYSCCHSSIFKFLNSYLNLYMLQLEIEFFVLIIVCVCVCGVYLSMLTQKQLALVFNKIVVAFQLFI